MNLISIKSVLQGERIPDAWLWLAMMQPELIMDMYEIGGGRFHTVHEPYDQTAAGITIPIPWPFWHDTPEYYGTEYAYWNLTLAIRRDDTPIRDGHLPQIQAGYWFSRRKPGSKKQPTTKTRNP